MIQVSVVVPTFKRVEQTVKILELLASSDGVGKEFELEIIVADSTPDTSIKDALVGIHLEPGVEPFAYVKPEHPGIAANKNAGVKNAHGQILIFSDSDMEVEKNTLLTTVNYLKNHDKAAAVGGSVIWKGGPYNGQKDRPRAEDRLVLNGDTTYIEALYSRYLATYSKVFGAVGGYDEQVFNMRGEGSDLSIRYWRAGYPLAYEESIRVHHVHDVPDAAAVRVDHAEWGIARDLLLLGYKYNMFEQDLQNFRATVEINFSPIGAAGYYQILRGIGKNMDMIAADKPVLDAFRANDKPLYDFKFLEIFSDMHTCNECISGAVARLTEARQNAFV